MVTVAIIGGIVGALLCMFLADELGLEDRALKGWAGGLIAPCAVGMYVGLPRYWFAVTDEDRLWGMLGWVCLLLFPLCIYLVKELFTPDDPGDY